MAKQNAVKKKSKKHCQPSFKVHVVKTPQKRGRKVGPPISRPSLPKSMNYVIKQIPSQSLKFGSTCNIKFKDDIKLSIGDKPFELLKKTIVGPYLNIPNCNYQGQITKCLLLLEVEQHNSNEIHVCHAKGNILKFGIEEFALITGLKCTGNCDDFKYTEDTPNRLLARYFPGANSSINKGRLVERFKIGGWQNDDDAVQMGILYFIHTFVISQLNDSSIPIKDFLMVEDGRFEQFPWGQLAFTKLMESLRHEFNIDKQMYRLSGMPYALNVWIYECASEIDKQIAVKEGDGIPRLCNWRVVAQKPKCEMFMSGIFTKITCNNIQPTAEELAALNLPDTLVVSSYKSSSSTAKSKQVEQQDLPGFEDFSTKPPEELVTRQTRASVRSSTPPPKRRKNDHPPKSKQQSEKLGLPHKSSIPIHDSPLTPAGNVFDTHESCLDKNKSHVTSDFERMKDFLKKYVDKKFKHLEFLINGLDDKLTKALEKSDNQADKKDVGGPSISTQMKGSDHEGDVNHFQTTGKFVEHLNSPIQMIFFNNEEQVHMCELKPVEGDDTLTNEVTNAPVHEGDVDHLHSTEKVVEHSSSPIQMNSSNIEEKVQTNELKSVEKQNGDTLNDTIMKDVSEPPMRVEQVSMIKNSGDTVDNESPKTDENATKHKHLHSTTSTSISSGTDAAIDVIVSLVDNPIDAKPLRAICHDNINGSSYVGSKTTGKDIVLHVDNKTPAPRKRMPSKIYHSPYLTKFGSSEKGKENAEFNIRQNFPFEGYKIGFQPPSDLIAKFSDWIEDGLLKAHAKKKSATTYYKAKCASFEFDNMDFVVASPKDKKWFYILSQPNKCWNDEHIDVVFYYLRKKSKFQILNQHRYTTANCLFKTYINKAYARYYSTTVDPNISTQEDMCIAAANAKVERYLINIIQGYSISAGLPWHSVDDVYIPINCDGKFHWVMAVVILKSRLIRVYDSCLGKRVKEPPEEIKKLSIMLPLYLEDSLFYEQTKRNDWESLDEITGSFLGPQHPFEVEFVQNIAQQADDSLDCGLYVAAFAEYLSDGITIPSNGLDSDMLRKRYAALIWRYGTEKEKRGYDSENDDPPRPKVHFKPSVLGDLVNLE